MFGLKSFCDNEQLINTLPAIKTPKRLKSLITPTGLIGQIIRRCSLNRTDDILRKYCPKKVRPAQLDLHPIPLI